MSGPCLSCRSIWRPRLQEKIMCTSTYLDRYHKVHSNTVSINVFERSIPTFSRSTTNNIWSTINLGNVFGRKGPHNDMPLFPKWESGIIILCFAFDDCPARWKAVKNFPIWSFLFNCQSISSKKAMNKRLKFNGFPIKTSRQSGILQNIINLHSIMSCKVQNELVFTLHSCTLCGVYFFPLYQINQINLSCKERG